MKYLILSSMLVLAAACSPAADQADPAAANPAAANPAAANADAAAVAPPAVDLAATEAEVAQFVKDYNDYYGANDMDRYFSVFDKDLTQLYASGRVNLEDYETSWRKGVAEGGGNTKVEINDVVVQVAPSGDAAVASYFVTVWPRRNGQPVAESRNYQETDVLFKKDGQWKVVHLNYRDKPAPRQNPAAAAPSAN